MTDSVIFHATPINDLVAMIASAINVPPMQAQPKTIQKEGSEYLTRKEVCAMLRISLSTLHFYTREGILKSYRIGGHVLYKTIEVHQSVDGIQAAKGKHRG
jgi:excisionase family DNA binding protein